MALVSTRCFNLFWYISSPPRWWFHVFFIFTSIWGRWTHFDSYFSNGLVQPPTTVAPFFWGGKFLQASLRLEHLRRQILEGLDFLHSEKIVHRDVKGVDGLLWWWCWRKGGGLKSRNSPGKNSPKVSWVSWLVGSYIVNIPIIYSTTVCGG